MWSNHHHSSSSVSVYSPVSWQRSKGMDVAMDVPVFNPDFTLCQCCGIWMMHNLPTETYICFEHYLALWGFIAPHDLCIIFLLDFFPARALDDEGTSFPADTQEETNSGQSFPMFYSHFTLHKKCEIWNEHGDSSPSAFLWTWKVCQLRRGDTWSDPELPMSEYGYSSARQGW